MRYNEPEFEAELELIKIYLKHIFQKITVKKKGGNWEENKTHLGK